MRLRKKHWAVPEMKENEYVIFNPQDYKEKWNSIFLNDNPIYLELGAGKGQFISVLSQREPNKNFIIFDRDTNAFVYACQKIEELELKNVRAVPENIVNIENYFEKESISGIFINFCNPWPKLRHQKRRLTHPVFLNKYKKFLKKEGKIFFKTDDLELFKDSLLYFKRNGFEILEYAQDLKEDYSNNIITEYERKWRDLKVPICFGIFKFK